MEAYQIEREVVIAAPADIVWRTITEPDQIRQWFADGVDLELRPGGVGGFVFDHEGGDSIRRHPLVVESVEPPTRFAFRWAFPDGEAPHAGNSVLVEFLLEAEGPAATRLRVVETGLADLGWSEEDKVGYADSHRQGWTRHLGRLVALFDADRSAQHGG